jgi:hypothetical protein
MRADRVGCQILESVSLYLVKSDVSIRRLDDSKFSVLGHTTPHMSRDISIGREIDALAPQNALQFDDP